MHQGGHVGRFLRTAPQNAGGEAPEGFARRPAVDFGHFFVDAVPHACAGHAGAVGVDGDVEAGQFLGGRHREGAHGVLAGAVDTQQVVGLVRGNAGGVDDLVDAAVLLLFFICSAAAWMPNSTPLTLMSNTRSNSVSVTRSSGITSSMPALLTKTSTRPKVSTACLTRANWSSRLATLP